jgi:hypothetical protein
MNALKDSSRILLLLGVCFGSSCGPAPQTETHTPVPQIAVPDQRDGEVLQILLLHLLSDPDFGIPTAPTNGAMIVLAYRTPVSLPDVERIRGEIGDHPLPSDLEHALFEYNRPNTVAYFTNRTFSKSIVVANLTDKGRIGDSELFMNAHPKARGYVAPFLPGYSKDGTRAIVRAFIGPSDHGARVTALLEKRGDKWVVKWHRLTFYG